MNFQELRLQIDRGLRPSLTVIYGEDSWQIGQAVKELAKHIPQDLRSSNIERISGKGLHPSSLYAQMQGSLFGNQRILVIEEPDFLRTLRGSADTTKKGKKEVSEETQWQDALCELRQDTEIVLLVSSSIDKRRKMFKWLEKEAVMVDCSPFNRGIMQNFIADYLKQVGFRAGFGVAERLQEIAGDAPGIAIMEIEKLRIAFPDTNSISLLQVQDYLSESVDAKAFALIDMLSAGKLSEALELSDELLRRGESVPRILAALTNQIRQMLQVTMMVQSRLPQASIASQLGLHAFRAKRLAETATYFGDKNLRMLLTLCCQYDSMAKSGRMTMENALSLFLIKVHAATKPKKGRGATA